MKVKATQPIYDFTKVNAPVHLFWSDDDWLADTQNIEEFLIPKLTTAEVIVVRELQGETNVHQENNHLENFNHMDFIWGLRAVSVIYALIIATVLAYQ